MAQSKPLDVEDLKAMLAYGLTPDELLGPVRKQLVKATGPDFYESHRSWHADHMKYLELPPKRL